MKAKIILLNNPEYEMAVISYKGEDIFIGNYWDFCPGCHGSVFKLDGKAFKIDDFSSCFDLADKLADKLETAVEVKKTKKEFW
jgi:hypothetical protein